MPQFSSPTTRGVPNGSFACFHPPWCFQRAAGQRRLLRRRGPPRESLFADKPLRSNPMNEERHLLGPARKWKEPLVRPTGDGGNLPVRKDTDSLMSFALLLIACTDPNLICHILKRFCCF